MERYALVKGDNELLGEELKREFVGINQSKYAFTGLTRDVQRVRQVFGSSPDWLQAVVSGVIFLMIFVVSLAGSLRIYENKDIS